MSTLQLLSPEREHRSLINQKSHFHLFIVINVTSLKKARQALGTSTTVQLEYIWLNVKNRHFYTSH